jgi:multiple sugar transport system permease protein
VVRVTARMTSSSVDEQAPASRGGLFATLDRFYLVTASWPALIVMVAVTAIPFAVTIGLAFTNYDLVRSSGWQFIGLGNFFDLAADRDTPQIIFNTAYLVVGTTVLETTLGLALAILMESGIRGIGFIRAAYLLPIMTAPVVVALTWRAMFNNDAGWINYFLGLAKLPQPTWLGDPALAMPAVIIADMWTGVSFMAVLLLAGLLAVPKEHKEAAETDGASAWQVFRHVTLPAIRPVLFIAIVLRFMDAFRKFEGVQILTTGGPGFASTPLNLHIYNTGLFYHQVGYAAAYGVVMILMIAASVGAIYLAIGRSR